MSDFKIRFRDQQTGRQIEVQADRLKQTPSARTADESFKTSKAGDGKVDILIKEKGWRNDTHSHLGIKTENLSKEDAAALKRALENPGSSGLSVMKAWGGFSSYGVSVIKSDAAGELAAPTPNIDTTGTRRPVQLTPSGQVATPDGREPQTLKESGDGLFRMASLIDDVKGNLFDQIQAPAALKEKTLGHLKEALAATTPGTPPPSGFDEKQTLQLRSSAATTLLELMTAAQDTPSSLRQQALEAYGQALSKETNPMLRDSMVLNLDRLQGSFPSSLRPQVQALVEAHAPMKPPYDKWFANGNNTVKIDLSNGAGEGFAEDNIKFFKENGFKEIGEKNGFPILEKTYVKNGVETKFQIESRTNRNDMFKGVADDNSHIVVYSGHSGWGKNVREALAGSPAASGDGKLIMTNLCVGKGELQQMKDKFPDAHVITTYNSEYFRQGGNAESHFAMLELFDGIADRRGYKSIAEDVRAANPWTSTHRSEGGIDNNFVFPSDLGLRRQLLDQDHDGQADTFDRLVDFNVFDVPQDTAREFQAIQPSRPADELVGTKVHFAAMSTNRIGIYSEFLHNAKSEITPGGYFQPSDTDKSLFRFQRDGGLVEMSMNAKFSHMSEEALRMASAFEYAHFKSSDGSSWPLTSRLDNNLNALLLASQSLKTDSGYRDSTVWSEFLKAYNLPNVSLSTIQGALEADHHSYSGSRASLTQLKTSLPADVLEALGRAESGVFNR